MKEKMIDTLDNLLKEANACAFMLERKSGFRPTSNPEVFFKDGKLYKAAFKKVAEILNAETIFFVPYPYEQTVCNNPLHQDP